MRPTASRRAVFLDRLRRGSRGRARDCGRHLRLHRRLGGLSRLRPRTTL